MSTTTNSKATKGDFTVWYSHGTVSFVACHNTDEVLSAYNDIVARVSGIESIWVEESGQFIFGVRWNSDTRSYCDMSEGADWTKGIVAA
jgi:hypothetical protein